MRGLSGYLLASTLGAAIERDHLLCLEPLWKGGPSLSFVGQPYRQWDEYELVSPISLEDESDRLPSGPGPFHYRFFAIRGFSKVVVLAERKRVVDYVLTQIFDRVVTPRLRKVALRLDEVIRFCETIESPYLVTSLLGRFAGPSHHLRLIILYGDDLTDTPLFREHGHFFNFQSCGVGRRFKDGLSSVSAENEREILRIGNDGSVFTYVSSRTKARDFLNAIGFVVANRWIEDWVPVIQSEPGALG